MPSSRGGRGGSPAAGHGRTPQRSLPAYPAPFSLWEPAHDPFLPATPTPLQRRPLQVRSHSFFLLPWAHVGAGRRLLRLGIQFHLLACVPVPAVAQQPTPLERSPLPPRPPFAPLLPCKTCQQRPTHAAGCCGFGCGDIIQQYVELVEGPCSFEIPPGTAAVIKSFGEALSETCASVVSMCGCGWVVVGLSGVGCGSVYACACRHRRAQWPLNSLLHCRLPH